MISDKLPFIAAISIVFLFSCSRSEPSKRLDFEYFTIDVPNSWYAIERDAIDVRSGALITSRKDTITFIIGANVGGFTQTPIVKPISEKGVVDYSPELEIIYSAHYLLDLKQGIFLKEYFMYDTINEYPAKIKLPKLVGEGETGIYFDSINSFSYKMNLGAYDLDSLDQRDLFKAFHSINFKSQ